ncbi:MULTISPECIES: hypothetical protein [Paenarthrobacter]|jgi:hypothetical protein|uniref:hypothetical protein n=1 Tax=Paenarthrobacter TaxID=1742992 RepID=UPI001BAC55AE|nr:MULTISPECIES: hypothetical protein [Paenarthrobacter]MDR6638585.1 hypothetical protein [Paenarthrobacter nitroguajacolicus]WOH18696.1 hypothetical protein IRJ34_20470 [Paenarthrobacter sp. GOM3]
MQDSRETARTLVLDHEITLEDLWAWYWANGGNARQWDFDAYLFGIEERDPFELKILAWAMEDLEARSLL